MLLLMGGLQRQRSCHHLTLLIYASSKLAYCQLLMAYAERPGSIQSAGRPKPGTMGTVYIAEEVIAGEFFKYIHNGNASPQ